MAKQGEMLDMISGRLTLETGVPISTSDQANKTTLYFTPFHGDRIALYDGAEWLFRSFSELSLAVGAYTASKPYDIWVYDNAGTPALDSTVWTDATNRATALALQDGILIKSGAATRRYVGTIYIDAGQKCQDTQALRYVWNYYNRVRRDCYYTDAGTHNYNSATWRQWNASAAAQMSFVIGVQEEPVLTTGCAYGSTDTNAKVWGFSLMLDNTNNYDLEMGLVQRDVATAANDYLVAGFAGKKWPGIGYHTIAVTERADAGSTATIGIGAFSVLING